MAQIVGVALPELSGTMVLLVILLISRLGLNIIAIKMVDDTIYFVSECY